MWQGSAAMLTRVMPYAAICYAAYESDTMVVTSQRITYSTENGFFSNFLRGAGACSIATLVMHPLDLVRVRLATSGARQMPFVIALRSMSSRGYGGTVSYTHLRAHETPEHLVCRLLLEKKKIKY
eukprot:TRINITY_DN25725_c0_g1_i2.p1 TRINITY_DN25725_c0_g1~~TRINITY_DN25725_c0_g1_i2.p1  ORF type:complete len:125 (+),score=18.64 TRINITY_DN25725_c0_g1_i2:216-590(+)